MWQIWAKIYIFRNLFYDNIPTFWDFLQRVLNVFILGGIVSRGVIHTLASPALRGYRKKDRNIPIGIYTILGIYNTYVWYQIGYIKICMIWGYLLWDRNETFWDFLEMIVIQLLYGAIDKCLQRWSATLSPKCQPSRGSWDNRYLFTPLLLVQALLQEFRNPHLQLLVLPTTTQMFHWWS